jgi:hypothetical protein
VFGVDGFSTRFGHISIEDSSAVSSTVRYGATRLGDGLPLSCDPRAVALAELLRSRCTGASGTPT